MPAEFQQPLPFQADYGDRAPAGNEHREAAAAELYHSAVEPVARRLLVSKLRVSLRQTDDTLHNQDALELLSEVKVRIYPKLRELDTSSGTEGVRNLDAYVRTVTNNVFIQFLRRKYPRRQSVRNQLRYFLTHHFGFSLWKDEDDRWICGPSAFRRNNFSGQRIELSDDAKTSIISRIGRAKLEGTGRAIIELTSSVFDFHAQPALLDDLLAVACEILDIEEPVEVVEAHNETELAASTDSSVHRHIEENEFVARLWNVIGELPLRHRAALLLNFRDDNGDSLITLLPMMRVASIRQIADALDLEHKAFAAIWNELPWDDNRIAEHLHLTRQQVINLRQSARQMLKRKLRPDA